MIKEVDKSGTIDLKSLEVGDKFLVFRGMPFLDDPFIYVTVLKLSEKKTNAVDTDGKKYGFSRLSKTLQCFSENSKFVEKEKIAMKIRFFLETSPMLVQNLSTKNFWKIWNHGRTDTKQRSFPK